MTGEFALISAIKEKLGDPPGGGVLWIGDDAAAVQVPAGAVLLLAADTVVGGVHADLDLIGLDDFGWKAVAASVSDVAAMGGRPGHSLVTVAGPPDLDIPRLYEGIAAAAAEFSCPVVGGDLTNSSAIVVTVAVTGYVDGAPVTRSGARPGDGIWVTGPLGRSAAGLRLLRAEARAGAGPSTPPAGSDRDPRLEAMRAHARPVPRLAAGLAARGAGASAMIDVSDGLSADIGHLADASGVGLRLEHVPVHPAATLDEALGGGEDFELIFCAADPPAVEEAFRGLDTPILIGRCIADPAERSLAGGPLPAVGWEHTWG